MKGCRENRELSWLKFNDRVLMQAKDKKVPLGEQLNFVSIFQSNMDEFFMVRIGTLYDQMLFYPSWQKKKGTRRNSSIYQKTDWPGIFRRGRPQSRWRILLLKRWNYTGKGKKRRSVDAWGQVGSGGVEVPPPHTPPPRDCRNLQAEKERL